MNSVLKLAWVLVFISVAIFAQAKPYWIDTIPESDYFIYFKGYGISYNEVEARRNAIADALTNLAHYKNLQITAITNIEQYTESTNSDFFEYDVSSKNIKLIGTGSDITGLRVVAEYDDYNRHLHNYQVLVRLPQVFQNSAMPIYKKRMITPLLKSAVLPGWGQLSKHDTGKGYFIVLSEGLSLLSAVSFKVLGDDYHNKSQNNSLPYSERQTYKDNADTAFLYANITLAIAGVVYIYNIIDAVSTNSNPLFTENNHFPSMYVGGNQHEYYFVCKFKF